MTMSERNAAIRGRNNVGVVSDRPKLSLWADSSNYAAELESKLRQKGYDVVKILTGSSEPVLSDGAIYVSGYDSIHYRFLL